MFPLALVHDNPNLIIFNNKFFALRKCFHARQTGPLFEEKVLEHSSRSTI